MDGVVTILEEKHYQVVQEIWQDLQQACGLQDNKSLTVPHFSWHVAQEYPDELRLDELLEKASLDIKPFTVRTAGLGIFFQPRLVVYVAVVKTRALIQLHQKLWEELAELAKQPLPYYAPAYWIPHITLVYEELTESALACALTRLANRQLDWEIDVNNLALIGQSQSESGSVCIQHLLRGKN